MPEQRLRGWEGDGFNPQLTGGLLFYQSHSSFLLSQQSQYAEYKPISHEKEVHFVR
jgi:hypothetical protein